MRATLTLAAVGLTLAAAAAWADDKKKDKELKLEGGYTVVAGEKYGQKEPEDRVKGTTVRFTKDKIVVTDKDKKEVYVSTYTLDASSTPHKITMTSTLAPSVGEVAKGLIKKDGDTIKLIYALPGGDMPTEFKTKEKQLMFEMKNTKKDDKKNKP